MKWWAHFSSRWHHCAFPYVIFAWALVLVTTARKSSWSMGGMSSTNIASPVVCLMADWCMTGCPTGSCWGWLGSTHCQETRYDIGHETWPLGLLCLAYLQSRITNYRWLDTQVSKWRLVNMSWVYGKGYILVAILFGKEDIIHVLRILQSN